VNKSLVSKDISRTIEDEADKAPTSKARSRC